MLRGGVVDINRQGYFNIDEANELLPIIHRFTLDYSQKVDRLIAKLEAVKESNTDLMQNLETEINGLINSWHAKVRKLGGTPKGLWIVDFDCQDGYYCWKYPEPEVLFWHAYDQGFSQRLPLAEKPVLREKNKDSFSILSRP